MVSKELYNITQQIIKARRSIFPASYTEEQIPDAIIEELLECANYAPTHRLTEPWRFKVLTDNKKEELGTVLGKWYKENTPEAQFSENKFQKISGKPRQSSHVIAIIMQRDPGERIPEWEEIASVAMAVQNIWLAAHSYGIGAYWSSPKSSNSAACRQFLKLEAGQTCLGFFYMGYHKMPKIEPKRTPIADKVEWL